MPPSANTGASLSEINRPCNLNIQEAKGGFIIYLQPKKSYDQQTHVATTVEEVLDIVRSALN